jgi:NADH:ubiquinone oxidoreductase subunit K
MSIGLLLGAFLAAFVWILGFWLCGHPLIGLMTSPLGASVACVGLALMVAGFTQEGKDDRQGTLV